MCLVYFCKKLSKSFNKTHVLFNLDYRLDVEVYKSNNDVITNILTPVTPTVKPITHMLTTSALTSGSPIKKFLEGPSTSKDAILATTLTDQYCEKISQNQCIEDSPMKCEDDSPVICTDHNDCTSNGLYTRAVSDNLQSEYSAMVAEVYENGIDR